jgi:hypothetical protein
MIRLVGAALALALAAPVIAMQADVPATVFVNPLRVELTLSTDRAVTGGRVEARVTVANEGGQALEGVVVDIRSDRSGVTVVGGANPAQLGRIGPGGTRRASWRLCAVQAGSYVILARARFAAPNGSTVSSESAADLLEVRPKPKAACKR